MNAKQNGSMYAWRQVEELLSSLGAIENTKSSNQESRRPGGDIEKEKLRCYRFANGKEVGLPKNKKKLSIYADTELETPLLKFKPREPSDGRHEHLNVYSTTLTIKNKIYLIGTQDITALRRYLEVYAGVEAKTELTKAATKSGLNITVPPSTPEILRDKQSEQALGDKDIDSANKLKYPIETIQERAILTRRGQPDFRKRLLAAYGNKCAVTGCGVRSVLEAAHIIPHADGTDWGIGNGLPLRADIHTLFDLRLLSVSPDYRVHISRELAGSDYENLHGKTINLPEKELNYPAPEKLAKHFEGFEERNSNK